MAKFYDEKFLAQKFKVERQDFHRRIKQIIISDFKDELNKLGIKNHDIGLDEKENIVLSDPLNHENIIETNLHISAYID